VCVCVCVCVFIIYPTRNPRPSPGLNTNVGWDPTLAEFGRQWINGCPGGHSGGPYGENLYFSSGVQSDADAIRSAMLAWFNEYTKLNMRTNQCVGGWANCGHAVQMLWQTLGLIGCSVNSACDGRGFIGTFAYKTIVACEFKNGVLGLPNGQSYPPYLFPGSNPQGYQPMPPTPPIGVPFPGGVAVPPNPPASGSLLNPITPTRILDTRLNGGAPVGNDVVVVVVVIV
jgi:hypothetical protein